MTIDAGLLRIWSRQLCCLSCDDPEEAAVALGTGSSVVDMTNGDFCIEPAPLGTTRFTLTVRWGYLAYVRVQLSDSTLTRADLDAVFGQGQELVRVHWDSAHT